MAKLNNLLLLLLLAAAAYGGYRVLREQARARVYQERLQELAAQHNRLRERYDHVVSQTAITELVVESGQLSVQVVGRDGVLESMAMPYDPDDEIHVDYAILDGRLWIRRVYDQKTAPEDATLIDPKLVQIDWSRREHEHGISVYRSLSEGRWVVNVTPNGAFSLIRHPLRRGPTRLSAPPPIVEFEQIERDTAEAVEDVGFLELLQAML